MNNIKITEETTKAISEYFNGDSTDSIFKYKSGPSIYRFFNNYFGTHYVYEQGVPSRWIMTSNALEAIDANNKMGVFFNFILSIKYLKTEYKEMTNDQRAQLSEKGLNAFNQILEQDDYRLYKIGGNIKLEKIDDRLQLIGTGGFANVYKIKGTTLALKRLKPDLLGEEGIASRFKREYEITKDSLDGIHGVIKVYDYNPTELSYTMDYCDTDLYKYIHENNLSQQQKVLLITQILQIMEEVHARKVWHRDLSPANIFFKDYQPIIADFGLGKDLDMFSSHQTLDTNARGTYDYCDPRQFMKLKDGDALSDIYSLGKLINFIMTKEPHNDDHILSMYQVLQ